MNRESISGSRVFDKMIVVVIILYSLFVMGTSTPALSSVSASFLILYYLLIPGFCLSFLLSEHYGLFSRILYSAPLSAALLLVIFALRHPPMSLGFLEYPLIVPILSLIALGYGLVRVRRMGLGQLFRNPGRN